MIKHKAVLASTMKGLQKLMTNLDDLTDGYGMKVNIKKTKVIQISKKAEDDMNIVLKNQVLEHVLNTREAR